MDGGEKNNQVLKKRQTLITNVEKALLDMRQTDRHTRRKQSCPVNFQEGTPSPTSPHHPAPRRLFRKSLVLLVFLLKRDQETRGREAGEHEPGECLRGVG